MWNTIENLLCQHKDKKNAKQKRWHCFVSFAKNTQVSLKRNRHMQVTSLKPHSTVKFCIGRQMAHKSTKNHHTVEMVNWTVGHASWHQLTWHQLHSVSQMPINQDLALICLDGTEIRWWRIHPSSFHPHSSCNDTKSHWHTTSTLSKHGTKKLLLGLYLLLVLWPLGILLAQLRESTTDGTNIPCLNQIYLSASGTIY